MKRQLRGQPDPLPASGRGYVHVCPGCAQPMTLHDLRDGDQAYWCHSCNRGHRAGDPPEGALKVQQAS
ncbi:hypothetical protein E7T09_17980 [Deinococcus sp. KSM4-11]|uniref:hypothetical protein n=1 Tax=Deinococcus sp. KSM4-11 TaxID=2568654 RepID=UPI0010A4F26E|nr:hypothetical protein [Deinococcus sp. KSM4-11]THF84942.1 hypothetical protein E7T09_17980 [Deinococcus sp. KSM4-11]